MIIAPHYKYYYLKIVILVVCGFSLGDLQGAASADGVDVIVRNPGFYESRHSRFIEDTLAKALEKADVEVNFVYAKTDFSRARMLQELITGENIHVVAHPPRPGWEESLLTVRIPLHKGIQGFRLFLINKQDQEKLAAVETLEQLLRIPTGSGTQWSTTRILREAGFDVVTAEGQGALYDMLRLRRFTTFGRGVFEVFSEMDKYGDDNEDLVLEQDLCLFIPLPVYFFVSPEYPELARQIETGLELMIEDGSFDEHFLLYHREDLERANLGQRRIFTIANPNLSPLTPLDEPSYWLIPSELDLDGAEDQG